MSSTFKFKFSENFISKEVKEGYNGYLSQNYGETLDDISDVINSTVQGVTIPSMNVVHPSLQRFKKSSVHGNELMERELIIDFRKIDGNINFYAITEEAFRQYDKSGNSDDELFIGDCYMDVFSKRGITIFNIIFKDCVLTNIELPDFTFHEVEPAEEQFSVTLEWNDLNIIPLPDQK